MIKKSLFALVLLGLTFGWGEAFAKTTLSTNLAPLITTHSTSGNPAGWHRGGYGGDTGSHSVQECDPNYWALWDAETGPKSGRHPCPRNAEYILRVAKNSSTGDAKWYFDDVKIQKNRKFVVSYDYQSYAVLGYALARYTMVDGSHQYVPIGGMTELLMGGHGYIGWSHARHNFTAPKGAQSLTIFFTVENRDDLPRNRPFGSTGITNVVLENK
jgi:hypothetical protein